MTTLISIELTNLSEYYEDFHDNPHDRYEQDALLRLLEEIVHEKYSKTKASAEMLEAFGRLPDFCNALVKHDAQASAISMEVMTKLILHGNWWRKLVVDKHEYIAAAVLILGLETLRGSKILMAVSETLSCWTGHDFSTTYTSTSNEVAEHLFGPAWCALYAGEKAEGFTALYRALVETRPPFTFELAKKRGVQTRFADVTLPETLVDTGP